MTLEEKYKSVSGATYHDIKDVDYSIDAEKNIICLQGSDEFLDWVRNFLFIPVLYKGKFVHLGFLIAYLRIKDQIEEYLENNSDVSVYGFSHGAAVAQILYLTHLDKVKECVCFGSPKPFLFGTKKLKNLVLVKNGSDAVTTLPPFFIKAKAEKVQLGKNKFPWFSTKDHTSYYG